MKFGVTSAPACEARTDRGPSRELTGGTAVSPRMRASRAPIALRSDTEIDRIAAAGALVAEALESARRCCVPGVTTAELDRVVREVISSAGGEMIFLGYGARECGESAARPPFPAASCISVNEELVHGVPGARVVRDGDMVTIDAGARLDGWCADSATTVCVGEVPSAHRALVETAEAMLARAIACVRPGVLWSSIAREMEAIAVARGVSVAVDFVGHGIGRELHEAPQVPNSIYASFLEGGDFTLRPGMVLAIEPMIVAETPKRNDRGELVNPAVALAADGWTVVLASGAASCHVEHTVAVTRAGARVLTAGRMQAESAARGAATGREARLVG